MCMMGEEATSDLVHFFPLVLREYTKTNLVKEIIILQSLHQVPFFREIMTCFEDSNRGEI